MGEKGTAWNNAKRKLKPAFVRAGITRCELCGSGFNLQFAHAEKRRFITTKRQLFEVALLCGEDHAAIEILPHWQMALVVRGCISKRETPVVIAGLEAEEK